MERKNRRSIAMVRQRPRPKRETADIETATRDNHEGSLGQPFGDVFIPIERVRRKQTVNGRGGVAKKRNTEKGRRKKMIKFKRMGSKRRLETVQILFDAR
mmetsp:Transcript_5245/g.14738  ORF Transcript_5245/g.14738 Transcript_5245/m.14738 type:complete len:100 (+) Transcript_5245:154-453(+)